MEEYDLSDIHPALTKHGVLGIVFNEGFPILIEVTMVTGKRARFKKPGTPIDSKIRSIPTSAIFEYDPEVWVKLDIKAKKIQSLLQRIAEIAEDLKPFDKQFKDQAGGLKGNFFVRKT